MENIIPLYFQTENNRIWNLSYEDVIYIISENKE